MPDAAPQHGGCNGGQHGPLAKIAGYYPAHLASGGNDGKNKQCRKSGTGGPGHPRQKEPPGYSPDGPDVWGVLYPPDASSAGNR